MSIKWRLKQEKPIKVRGVTPLLSLPFLLLFLLFIDLTQLNLRWSTTLSAPLPTLYLGAVSQNIEDWYKDKYAICTL